MYKTSIEPRVSETDGVGHINNTVIPVWLEAARNPIFKLFTPDDDFQKWKMIIIHMNIDYLSQIYYGKDVEINTWVNKIGNSSLELYEEVYQDDMLCAKNTVVYVNYNLNQQVSEPIPENIRRELNKHLLLADDAG
ncbi:acyl-CoA thioesterase [Oceanobacillus senegalensis]|uniref:acyl-CoA thioesterase n=1 Tax=Oceanobacillus senegalensis TaxID=1936063 RepID=UPI000A30D1EF|nr:thioesterase family protein [Oceanobacillus senegalensis]